MGRWIEAVDAWAGPWSEAMARASWQGGLGLALVWAWCRAVPRTPPAVQCWLWRLGYAKLLVALLWATPVDLPVLPAAEVPGVAARPAAAPVEPARARPADDGLPLPAVAAHRPTPDVEPRPAAPAVAPPESRPSVASALLAAWVAGVLICAVRLGRAYVAAARMRSRCEPIDDRSVDDVVGDLCRRLGLRRPPRVAGCADSGGPLLTGLLRPLIVLPRGLRDAVGAAQLRLMLAHELAHLRRRDLGWGWLAAAAESLFFFHPAIWLARRHWRLAQEIACDEAAVAVTRTRPAEYGRALLGVVEAQCLPPKSRLAPVAAVGVIESVKTIERRLKAMRHFRFQPWSPTRRILTGGVVAFVAAVGILPWRVVAQQDEARQGEDRPAAQRDEEGGSARRDRPAGDEAAPRTAGEETPGKDDPKAEGAAPKSGTPEGRDLRGEMRRRRAEEEAKPAAEDAGAARGAAFRGWLTARTVEILARSDGVVKDVKLKEGQRVKAGDVLFEIENSKIELQLRAAMGELQATKATLDRMRKLNQDRAAPLVSNTEVQEAEAKVETAQSHVRLREAELSETRILAPFAGTVAEAKAQPGQYVRAGSPLTTLVESDVLQVVFECPQVFVPRVRPGTKLELTIERIEGPAFEAEVSYVAPQLDPRSQTIRVKGNVADPKRRLLPGMTVRVLVPEAAGGEARPGEEEPRNRGGGRPGR